MISPGSVNMVEPVHDSALEPGEVGQFEFVVPAERAGQRLDHFLVEMLPDLTRSRIANLIRDGFIMVNDGSSKAAAKLKDGDIIDVIIPKPEPLEIKPEKVDFQVLYEDDDMLVIAKPPGVVVHPACGHKEGTLVHGLLAHCDNLSGISGVERPGIVHRLDKDTSGVMVVAKNDRSHHGLIELFKSRQVKKTYHALVVGHPATHEGIISQPIGRHRGNRKKMAVLEHGGREAVTRWTVLEELGCNLTYIEVRPETGRTHQIRVHMAFSGHPVAGDSLYGGKQKVPVDVMRQCLHAYSLSFQHPVTGEAVEFIAPVWPDMQGILETLLHQKNQ
ncbi:RluA family pseudouridine synthase [Thermodesulfobacteriota bacterium]